MSEDIVDAHSQSHKYTETIFYPDHDPRKASSEYKRVHNHLINELDEPCWICGIRKSTGGQMETHHFHLEWALANSADPEKIIKDFPDMDIADIEHLRAWLDSEGNMLVLCEHHHRAGLYGIHSVTYPAWVAQRYQKSGWDLAEGPKND